MARSYETLEMTRPAEWVVQVQLNRPGKSNAMNIQTFWRWGTGHQRWGGCWRVFIDHKLLIRLMSTSLQGAPELL